MMAIIKHQENELHLLGSNLGRQEFGKIHYLTLESLHITKCIVSTASVIRNSTDC